MFGWSAEECLDMPASRFFLLVRSGRKVERNKHAMHMADMCDVSSIALANSKYYEIIKHGFVQRLMSDLEESGAKPTPARTPGLDGTEAQGAVISMFSRSI